MSPAGRPKQDWPPLQYPEHGRRQRQRRGFALDGAAGVDAPW